MVNLSQVSNKLHSPVTWLSILLLTGLSWYYMLFDMTMIMAPHWHLYELTMVFMMWAVMMVGMMLPSATPMILLFAKISQTRQQRSAEFVSSNLFILGYLLLWSLFSLVITLVQWQLHELALMTPMMKSSNHIASGILLILIGIYQISPLKQQCLNYCRSPLNFLMTQWQEGKVGAVKMGLKHGLYCVGCCWLLMTLLLVVGVMHIGWILALSILVLLEKVVSWPEAINLGICLACLGFGLYFLVG
ncbi:MULTISPECIES: DUF2182 domain-containing protein [unclassified Shewanella]|uniref:DUF2182 domain-containing protein n=1 Tax=unclassified Shewanella TaxID=196818 RepID=UPI001BC2F31E|nr:MULTISPECIES: DUF2182 domain-containing protein [unclassified Shewanella]GIU05299.1 hypothetical protein TUM4444_01420 [Shewanella sp. MBTL60-112-B1]GIU24154.1 hypothetical protein TUM4445_00950 [Shewanella sp. MBTL60-112-B2]